MTRTFQIVQPFAAQTVRENIAVGAHLHEPRAPRPSPPPSASRRGSASAAQLDKPAADLTVAGPQASGAGAARWPRAGCCCSTRVLAGLNPQEIAEMIPVVRGLARGITC